MPAKQFFIKADDGTSLCCYLEKHPNPITPGLVVLIHGRLDDAHKGPLSFLPKLDRFYDTLRIDMRGMGRSEGTTTYDNARVEGRDVSKVLSSISDHYSGQVLAIAGHSQGASTTFFQAIDHPKESPPLLINVSGRYDAKGSESRFNEKDKQYMQTQGPLPWIKYWRQSGQEKYKDTYFVSKEALESYLALEMDCVSTLDQKFKVLNIHGKADGTVWASNAEKYNSAIKRGKACSDLVLLEGIKHGWDSPGEVELLGDTIANWIKHRSKMDVQKVDDKHLVDLLAGKSNDSASSTL